jgi:hypothetical protein
MRKQSTVKKAAKARGNSLVFISGLLINENANLLHLFYARIYALSMTAIYEFLRNRAEYIQKKG